MAEYRLEFVADGSQASRTIAQLEKAIKEITKEFKNAEIGSEDFLVAASQISVLTQETNKAKSAVIDLDKAQKQLSKTIAEQQRAIMQFRAGMGAKGAIPEIASPVRGGAKQFGSPAYFDALEASLKQAIGEAQQIAPPPQAFAPGSLAAYEEKLKKLQSEARLIAPTTGRWKELTQEIKEAERSIQNINKKQRLGPTMGQRAGAAGGAFLYGGGLGGGVGSALGGVAGGLAGGVSGAFTGAALGQFADNVGNALAATAKFTAEIDKQRIALRNVIGDAQQYEQALAFIDKTSKELAIPQEILNQSFTQISASVLGAGGSVRDAEEAFLGIAAGIRGTGGSLADMEGALRATAQVFSKGKVSAEELRQQIGERLPGAFTLFAQSIGKTPQELDKMLEQGQVGLNDFMVFVRQLSSTYGASAQEIAASTQAAGDRMAVAMSTMREAVGRELQPVGAEFQAVFADFVQNQTPNFISATQALAEALKPLIAALKTVAENAEAMAAGLAAFAAVLAAAQLPAAIAAITVAVKALTAAALANPFVALAAGIGLVTVAAVQGQQEINRYNDLIDGSAGSQEDLQVAIAQTAAELKQAEANMNGNGRMAEFAASKVDTLRNRLLALEGRYKAVIEIEQIFTGQKGVPAGYKKIDGRLAYEVPGQGFVDAETGKVIKQQTSGFKPAAPTGGGGKSKRGSDKTADRAARIQAEIQGLQRQTALTQQLAFLDEQIANAAAENNQQLMMQLQQEEQIMQLRHQLADALAKAETQGQRDALLAKTKAEVDRVILGTAIEISKTEEDRQKQLQNLLQGFDREIELAAIKNDQARALRQIEFDIEDLQEQKLLNGEAEIEQYRRKAQAAAAIKLEEQSPGQKRMQELQKSVADLTNLENVGVMAADSIGMAFGQAFQDIANGSATAQEALANMMKSIGENFVNMAAQIIAQQMTMIILGAILKALGIGASAGGLGSMGGGGGFGSFSGGSFGVDSSGLGGGLTGGGLLGGGGMYSGIKFAEGGFVTGPTQALIGEAGESEYVIPASKMSSAMARYSAGARGAAVIPSEGGEGISSMSIGAPTSAIDVRYSVERINSVDYVTADQFQRGMAQAAQQGAKQGEQMTLRRLQQSRSTRGRLGLN